MSVRMYLLEQLETGVLSRELSLHPISLTIFLFFSTDMNIYTGTMLLSMDEERRSLKKCIEKLKKVTDSLSMERSPEERIDHNIFVS